MRGKMRKFIIQALCLFTGSFSFLSSSSTAASTIEQNTKKMLKEAEIGEVVPLLKIFDSSYDHVCIIPPYANMISYSPNLNELINSHLSDIDYKGSESEWAIAITKLNKVEIMRFKRDKYLDILSERDFINFIDVNRNFNPSNCTSIKEGVFLKVSFRGRNYIVLGYSK